MTVNINYSFSCNSAIFLLLSLFSVVRVGFEEDHYTCGVGLCEVCIAVLNSVQLDPTVSISISVTTSSGNPSQNMINEISHHYAFICR